MNTIPVVAAHPLWQLLQWTFKPFDFLSSCEKRYGDCFAVQLGTGVPKVVVVSNPQVLEELFAASNAKLFDSGRTQHILKVMMGEHSLLVSDGEPHRRHRQLLMPPSHSERMREYGDLICQITQNVAQQWQMGQSITMLPHLNDITLQVILEAVFGLHEGDRYHRLRCLLRQFLDWGGSPVLYLVAAVPLLQKDWGKRSPVNRFKTLQAEIDRLIFEEIQECRAHLDPNRPDVLTLMLMARDQDGQPMSDQELRDELVTMILAGHDSSAATLAWTFYHIYNHPDVKAKILDELASLGDHPEPMEIARLPYLSAACSESLRLRASGPVILARITNAPVKLHTYKLPAHTVLLPCIYLTLHRPDIYPNPDQFQPERFLERQYAPSEYFPFGGNNRRCIAAAFALFEMKLVIATVLRHYHLKLLENRPVKAVRRHINVAPGSGIRMQVVGRIPVQRADLAIAR